LIREGCLDPPFSHFISFSSSKSDDSLRNFKKKVMFIKNL
jgi:hypothetical protein